MSGGAAADGATRRASRRIHLAAAALAFLPLLLAKPGRLAADTRPYLYLDPGGFVDRGRHLWDPFVHLGTVTHQNMGILVPMGAWFWSADLLGLPDWIAQRIWVGALLFAAATGVLHLGRTLAWPLRAAVVAAACFSLSPYVLQYVTSTSVLLLPFAGLPWMVSFAVRATVRGGWRDPAAFALVVFLVGSVNATAFLLAGLGPLLWVGWAAATGLTPRRQVLAAVARIGVLGAAVSAWWVAALVVQARHGLPVLAYTETVDSVATTSAAQEVMRGLGYWVFYGRDVLDPNVAAAVPYTQSPWLLTASYLLPGLGLLAAFFVRFPHRGYFVALIGTGVVVAVGAHPIDDPSPFAAFFRDAADTTAGLALRSSTRAAPLAALGLAACLGHATLAVRRPLGRAASAYGAVALAVVALPALLTGGFVDPNRSSPEDPPAHWTDAGAWLDEQRADGGVLEIPGSQFAFYRWGYTFEPVTPGLTDRAVLAREQLPYGSPASADLLIALDRRLQEGLGDLDAVPAIARLLGTRWVVLRNDLAFERYRSPRPRTLAQSLDPLPDGLRAVASFGPPVENVPDPRLPLLDEHALALPDDVADPSPVEMLEVEEPAAHLRLAGPSSVIIDGDGEGLVDAAAAGLIDGRGTVLYGSTVLDDPALRDGLEEGQPLIVTDTNRKRVRRWRSVRWSTGHTERVDEAAAASGDAGLDLFPDAGPDRQTTVDQVGGTATATSYGSPYTLDPAERPALVADGLTDTSWTVGPFANPVGEALQLRSPTRVSGGTITILQRQAASGQWITAVDLSIDGGAVHRIALDERSLTAPGQTISLPEGVAGRELQLEVASTSAAPGVDPASAGPVGFAEVDFGDVRIVEVVVLPTATLDAAGDGPLSFVMTRLRSDPAEPVRGDEERILRRRFRVPGARTLQLTGDVRLSAHTSNPVIDRLLGRAAGPVVTSSSSLPGALHRGPSAAFDGDVATRWEPAFRDLEGAWIQAEHAAPLPIDHLDLEVVADGRHSVPTRVRVEVDGQAQEVDLPPIEDRQEPGATVTVPIPLTETAGRTVKVTVVGARPVMTIDYYTRADVALPVGIAELGLPGSSVAPATPGLDTGCRDDLLLLDGEPLPVRITGVTTDAVARRPLTITACEPLRLAGGDHELVAADGRATGLDLDRLVLGPPDGPGGQAVTPFVDLGGAPTLHHRSTVPPTGPGWLVLAQSHGDGWEATLDGRSLGAPTLVDGASTGWFIEGADEPRSLSVDWRPQGTVNVGMLVSAAALVACGLILVTGRRRGAAGEDRIASMRFPPTWFPRTQGVAVTSARAWALVLGAAVGGALALHPLAGLLSAAAAAAALWHQRGRAAVALAGLASWTAAVLWITVSQILRPRRPDFEWVAGSLLPHRLALLAVILLLVTAATDRFRRRPGASRPIRVPVAAPAPVGGRTASPAHRDRRRFLLGCALGGMVGLLLYAWLLTVGQASNLSSWQRVGDFYDNQAKAWIDGHWDLPPETLGIERFEARGRAYMYQGPWPALLRLPIVAVTQRFEGRLTQASMLAGVAVAIVGASLLQWRVRNQIRGPTPVGPVEAGIAGILTFAVTGGSALLFSASRAWVYHEAIVWGAAWALVAFAAIVGVVVAPNRWNLLTAGTATTLALCSRSSVGLGPAAALGLVAAGNGLIWARARLALRGRPDRLLSRLEWLASGPAARGSRPIAAPTVAALLPLAIYAATNWIKFRTPFGIPFASQGFTIVDPGRQAMLEANDGTLFGLDFLPTTVLQYLRPDAWRGSTTFPFVDFADPTAAIGGAHFDLIDRSTSIPVAMPGLLLLALVGVIALVRHRQTRPGAGPPALRGPALGALVSALTILPFGYIANRYLVDVVPLLAIGSFIGAHALLARWNRGGVARWRAALAALVLGGLVVVGCWVNLSTGLIYQRAYSPNAKDDVLAGFLDRRYDVSQALGLSPDIPLVEVDALPDRAPRGTIAVIGDCDGMYLSDGMDTNAVKITPWNAVERTEDGGRWLRRVTFPAQPPGTRQPLWSSVSEDGRGMLYAEWVGPASVVFGWDGPGPRLRSPVRHIPPDREWTMDLVVDRHLRFVQLYLDGFVMLETYYNATTAPDLSAVGRDVTGDPAVDDQFTGRFDPLPERVGVCAELRAEKRLVGGRLSVRSRVKTRYPCDGLAPALFLALGTAAAAIATLRAKY